MFKIDNDEYLYKEELAAIFRIEEKTLTDWISKGDIPSLKLGKVRVFHMATINEWLKEKIEQ